MPPAAKQNGLGEVSMRKLTLFTLVALAVTFPLQAKDTHQSYIAYDDGGTIVRSPDDGSEIDGRVNLPVYPGDEVVTSRRGRTEIVLSDGNVVAIDRSTALHFRSIRASYDGEDDETVAELRYGKVMLFRAAESRDYLRLDTPSATYFASNEATFSVETDVDGNDRVTVFDGSIEVRTPDRKTRLRRGEGAQIDDRGDFDLTGSATLSADDFERWFLRRTERYGAKSGRYLDRSLAYYEDELSRHGSWVNIGTYGWAWRPTVAAGWRPYYHGQWGQGRNGHLTWVSYEPWGWVPYHYGRWSHDPYYGWFWVPGIGYAPAWVYWWYGSNYIGWAPSGFYDLHRPYYDWAYRPYSRSGLGFGFGFYGRVRVNDIDLRPWTFIDSNTIVSNRVDRAAITTDVIRGRLTRDNGGFGTVSSGAARFTREEFRDPAASINRRMAPIFRESGGAPADMTPFFRRDDNLSGAIRDRIVRSRPSDGSGATAGRTIVGAGGGGGGLAPVSGGGVAPIGGSVAPIGRGSLAPVGGGDVPDRVNRGNPSGGGVTRGDAGASRGDASGRIRRDGAVRPRGDDPVSRTPEAPARENNWRDRAIRGKSDTPSTRADAPSTPRDSSAGRERGSDVPRRVIDRIGGARVRNDDGKSRTRESSPPPAPAPRSVDRPSSGNRDSSPPPARESAEPRNDGSSRQEGGRVKRDQ